MGLDSEQQAITVDCTTVYESQDFRLSREVLQMIQASLLESAAFCKCHRKACRLRKNLRSSVFRKRI